MFKKVFASLLALSLMFTNLNVNIAIHAEEKQQLDIAVVTTNAENDLYKTLVANYDGIHLYGNVNDALSAISTYANDADVNNDIKGMMILADNYPSTTTVISEENAAAIKEAGIRLYIEYPENNSTLGIEGYSGTNVMNYNRAIVTNATNMNMANHSLLYVHGARFVSKQLTPSSIDSDKHWLVSSKVAGYDVAEFGITEATYSLIEVNSDVMIASTKFSQFISARYAPYERYQKFWTSILSWVSGTTVNSIEWTPLVNAHYDADEVVDENDYKEAVRLNTEWYKNTGFIVSEEDNADYMGGAGASDIAVGEHNGADPVNRNLTLGGDGSYGILEAFVSGKAFTETGEQLMRFWRRADCNGESAGNIALAGVILDNDEYKKIAYNVVNWLLTESYMSQGDRANPDSPEYGLLTWHDGSPQFESYWGDDNAKAILGLISALAALRNETDLYDDLGFASKDAYLEKLDALDKRVLEAIIANYRTTSTTGMRDGCLDGAGLSANGWEYYFNRSVYHYAPHFEALIWATYLWAYNQSGYEPLLERTKTGITNMMNAYAKTMEENSGTAGEWKWTNGLQQERAKMILPLAWLVRIEPTTQNINWLNTMISDLMLYQDEETGALQDRVGEPGQGNGTYGSHTNNAHYGGHEAPVIQNNGDPCIDALYTASFAMMSLNESMAAVKASGNTALSNTYKAYSDKLSDFFVRIQSTSTNKTYNGVWFRGFDYEKWEVYGSDGDAAWGVWCTETGWSQSWISNTLSMKVLNTNIWDYSQNTSIADSFEETAILMLNYDPNDLGNPTITFNPSVTRPSTNGDYTILDDIYGTTTLTNDWMGVEGKDYEFVVDFKEEKTFGEFTLGFLKSWQSGIRVPESITIYGSSDGTTYTEIGTMGTTNAYVSGENAIERVTANVNDAKARYIKVSVKNPGLLPAGHHVAGAGSWVFMDEFDWTISKATISDLYDLLEETRPLLPGAYTDETGSVFETARDAAETVYAKDAPTADEIDKAYQDLKAAYDNLEADKYIVSMTASKDGDNAGKLIDSEYAKELTHTDDAYIGWQNTNTIEAVIDLKEVKGISKIGYSALSRPAWGIYVPATTVYVSEDGTTWKEVGTIAAHTHSGNVTVAESAHPSIAGNDTVGRYVKYVWTTSQEWVFIDEVEIETYTYVPASIIDVTNLAKADLLLDKDYGFVPLVDPWRTKWAEFEGGNITFTVDLGKDVKFDTVKLGFLQAYSSGIVTPKDIKISVSKDNVTFTDFGTMGVENPFTGLGAQSINRLVSTSTDAAIARYVKVEIKNPGTLPAEHGSAGAKSWIMMDEIEVTFVGTTLEALKEVIDSKGKVNIEVYTEETAQPYIDALANAKALYASADATSDEIDAAIEALNTTYANLKLGRTVISMTGGTKDKSLLVDDKYAPSYIHTDAEYIGWQNATTFEAVVDLGSVQPIDYVGFSSSSRPQWGIYPPNATVYVSDDNVNWEQVAYLDAPAHTLDPATPAACINGTALDNVNGRYVKYVFENDDSHLMNGVRNEWVFMDEVIINDMDVCKDKLQTLVDELETKDVSKYGEGANNFNEALAEAKALLEKENAIVSAYQNAYVLLKEEYEKLADLPIIVYDKTLGKPGASGLYTILDGNLGSTTPDQYNQAFGNGTWTGIEKEDITVTITLPEAVEFNQLSLGFLQEYLWGIRYPEYVTFYISEDGENWSEYDTVTINKEFAGEDSTSYRVISDITPASSKYFKIFMKNGGVIGEGHPRVSAGTPTWLFWDEFVYETVVDTRDLVDAISTIEGLDKSLYTSASVETLDTAIVVATAVLANEDATQEEVDAALEALVDAYNALVNISSLKEVVEEVENTDTSKYTEASVKAFEDALKAAKEALIDGTDGEVEAAEKALVEAYNALEEKPVEEEAPGTGDPTNVAGLLAMLLASAYVLTRKRRA